MTDKAQDAKTTVELIKDGPLKVSGLEAFYNAGGEAIATKEVVFLCRCGASENKPFCDGAHSRIGFTDEK